MEMTTEAMGFELEAMKPPKAKSVKKTAQKRAVKATDTIKTHSLVWVLVKRFVKFIWVNKVPITVNLFILENGYFVARYMGVI